MTPAWISLFVFVGCYLLFVLMPQRRSWVACGGGLALCALAGVISMFVENVAVVLLVAPVALSLADKLKISPVPLLMFGLLIGACLGGNLTPIGASANVVTLGILKKRGHAVTFREFMGLGVPFTFAAVASACAFVWLVWGT